MPAPPSHAVLCWTDSQAVYLEVSGARISYPLSEAGLSRALNFLRQQPPPKALPPARLAPASRFSEEQLAMATAFLRRAHA